MSDAGLSQRLRELGYAGVFLRDGNAARLAARERSTLASIAADPGEDATARFLAVELLTAVAGAAPELPDGELAEIYVAALRANVEGMANVWVFPSGALGEVGERLVSLGEEAVEPLLAALGETEPLTFYGSREATIGNSYAWRVKDAAAALLAAVTGETFQAARDPAARDAAIDDLRRRIASGGGAS